jgi:hypothetical protein
MKTEKELLLNNIRNILVDVEDSLSIEDIIVNLNKNNIMNITKEKMDQFEKLLDSNRHLYGIMKSNKKTYKAKDKKRNIGIDPLYTEKHYEKQYKLSGDKDLYSYLIEDIITNEFKNDPKFNETKFRERYDKICKDNPRLKKEFIFSHIDKRLYWRLDEISPSIERHSKEDNERFRIDFKKKLLSNVQALKKPYVPKSEHMEDVINNCREYISYGMMYHNEYKNASKKVKDAIKEKYKTHEVFKSQKFGEIPTPISVCERHLDKYGEMPDEYDPNNDWCNPYIKWIDMCVGTGSYLICITRRLLKGLANYCDINPNTGEILDLRTEEARYKWIIENMIYACEIQPINLFIWMFFADPYDQYKLNIHLGSSIDNNFLNYVKNEWNIKSIKNVRVVINPPYNDMMDMDFIKIAYQIAEDMLFVHPSTWLLDEKNIQKKFTSAKDLIKDSLDSIELFNGNELFGIDLFVPLCFTRIKRNRGNKKIHCIDRFNNIEVEYDNIWQINKFSNIDIYPELKEKIIKNAKNDNILNHKNIENGNYFVNLSPIRGNISRGFENSICSNDFYTLIPKNTCVTDKKEKKLFFSFPSKIEAENFIEYLKSNFSRFCLAMYKNNQNTDRKEMSIIPWLDFTEKWTDDKLNNLFNLSEKQIEFINKFIPKYY